MSVARKPAKAVRAEYLSLRYSPDADQDLHLDVRKATAPADAGTMLRGGGLLLVDNVSEKPMEHAHDDASEVRESPKSPAF